MNRESSKRILVLGADGMAGSMIIMYLRELGYDVYSTSRGKDDSGNSHYNVLDDYRRIEGIIESIKPNFVINCIGVLNQFAEANKAGAVLVNSFLPHYIDSISEKHKFKFIHISTDCVFSGLKGNYVESDSPDATSFYGRSKALGEVNNGQSISFRTSIVGPDIKENGIGLFNWFIKKTGTIHGYSKVIWTGVTTLELAKSIERSFDMEITGLYHLVNNEQINKLDLLRLFKKYMKKEVAIDEENSSVSDKSLVNTRKDYGFEIPSYEEMVREMSEWIFRHESVYADIILHSKK